MDLTYLPFAAAGLALRTAWISDAALSRSWSAENEILPTGTWMIDVLSTRNSTLPALISEIALATSNVTVPVFGFGISPRAASSPTPSSESRGRVFGPPVGVLLRQPAPKAGIGVGVHGVPPAFTRNSD